jgi:hypothetical protein
MKFTITPPVTDPTNFSFKTVETATPVLVPLIQQMIVYQEFEVEAAAEIEIEGEVVIIE